MQCNLTVLIISCVRYIPIVKCYSFTILYNLFPTKIRHNFIDLQICFLRTFLFMHGKKDPITDKYIRKEILFCVKLK